MHAWTTELLNDRNSELLKYWTSKLLNYYTPELLNFWTSELFWILELLNFCSHVTHLILNSEPLNSWTPKLLNYKNSRTPKLLNPWTPELLNSRTLKLMNSRTPELRMHQIVIIQYILKSGIYYPLILKNFKKALKSNNGGILE